MTSFHLSENPDVVQAKIADFRRVTIIFRFGTSAARSLAILLTFLLTLAEVSRASPEANAVLVVGGASESEPSNTFRQTLSGFRVPTVWSSPSAVSNALRETAPAALVFTRSTDFLNLPADERSSIESFCGAHRIGMLFLDVPLDQTIGGIRASTVSTGRNERIHRSAVPRLLKAQTKPVQLPMPGRILVVPTVQNHFVVSSLRHKGSEKPTVIATEGPTRRIYSSNDAGRSWLDQLLVLDAISWLSSEKIAPDRRRWILVDIDDVFQPNYDDDPAKRTVKIHADDVEALVATQEMLDLRISGTFRFSLGFNSGFFRVPASPSAQADIAGDDALVRVREKFWWFDHLPLHEDVTEFTRAQLTEKMESSKKNGQSSAACLSSSSHTTSLRSTAGFTLPTRLYSTRGTQSGGLQQRPSRR